jgi:putative autoinducer-2 (AI-2) aldolase
MEWGMQNRLSRIIRPDTGRAVMLAVDHGYFLGPVSRLEDPGSTVEPLLPYTDTLMVTRGVLRNCVDPDSGVNVVLRVSGGQSIVGPAIEDETLTTSMDDAIRLNAAAVALSIYVGTEHEHQTLASLADLADEGLDAGIPVLAVTAVGKELEKRDARYLGLCCRIAAELGAQIVKTYYCDEFEKVTHSCPVPIVIAGGPRLETEMDALQMTRHALEQGAVGVDMGRNIWQSEHPVAMIRAIRGVVHEGMSAEEAHDLFQSLKGNPA